MLMRELDPRCLGSRESRDEIAISEVLASVAGAVLGMLRLLMGVGKWPGGEVRPVRSE